MNILVQVCEGLITKKYIYSIFRRMLLVKLNKDFHYAVTLTILNYSYVYTT